MRQSDWKPVRALPLFAGMSEANFEMLVSAASLEGFPLHTTLIHEGDLPDFLHIVVNGSVEMFSTHNGHETTIDILRPGSTFVLAAAVRNERYLKSARTLSPAQILMIPAPAVREAFDRDAAFARAIVNELAERYRSVVRSLKNEKLRTSAERLANWILQADAQQGHRHSVELAFDKRKLASRLGMTPENLSRNLALLAKYGVKSSGRDIVIEDPSALESFAKPNASIDG
ncbi:MAG TPA: cyclic nucleotide-binding domain-containing protein [Pseudolabrys sp.]|nr:cyclic nucleotide-binding domain-containing protein [Pseudolabrys sp.]